MACNTASCSDACCQIIICLVHGECLCVSCVRVVCLGGLCGVVRCAVHQVCLCILVVSRLCLIVGRNFLLQCATRGAGSGVQRDAGEKEKRESVLLLSLSLTSVDVVEVPGGFEPPYTVLQTVD